ncbi:hypothetical protein Pryu01_01247 [Paraliobacillus ryukyuensis]|uniref:Uncharacterized protein n=1 Tax=Paraliobacillus ryukyuensis TaxID=200904 RepID=A0A366ECQ5_9BACI|nr:hypothetical protein [Paraliobacillus ryukyuensis]RBO99519.1 hypothetical protein DES48_104195 [Paraliobacillus ryukyuensis]
MEKVNQKIVENKTEVIRYQKIIDKLTQEDKVDKIYLLSKQLIFIGRLSTIYYEINKQLYIKRKLIHSEEYIKAKGNKSAAADLAVADIRRKEIEADIQYKRWNTAFKTTVEEINALKYKVRIDLADGSNNSVF